MYEGGGFLLSKWSDEKVKQFIKDINPEYEFIDTYKGVDTRMKFRHLVCGNTIETTISHIKERGINCKYCLNINQWTTESYNKRLEELYNGEFVLAEDYKGSRVKTKHIHTPCGNTIEISPDNLLRGRSSCMYCNNRMQWNTVLFKNKVKELDSSYECLTDYINNSTYVIMRHSCGYEYKVTPANFLRGKRCPYCVKSNYVSKFETDIVDFIKDLGIKVVQSYVGKCQLQLDIYLPDYKIGFEINGVYWHCSKYTTKYHHRNKVNRYLEEGIKVYNLWDYWGIDKIKSIILSKVNKTERVYARNCSLVTLDSKSAKIFFDSTHVDNYTHSKVVFALEYKGEIQCALGLRNHKEGIEISRYANKLNTTVVGGYSKLLKHAIYYSKINNYKVIISYCDRDLSPDPCSSFYSKHGFKLIKNDGLILKFYNSNDGKVYSRQTYQKCKNKNMSGYDESKSNKEILENNNIYEIWNSGNFKYELHV